MSNKKDTKNKKSQVLKVKDLSLSGLLTSHRAEFLKTKEPSQVIYQGGKSLVRWSGGFAKDKNSFSLYHYNTPILKVELATGKVELVSLPKDRKGLSWSDIRGINTTLKVFGVGQVVKKNFGVDTLVKV